MLGFSRFVFPEGGKGISCIVLSPASSIDLAPFGLGTNVCRINEWLDVRAGQLGGHIPSGLGLDEE